MPDLRPLQFTHDKPNDPTEKIVQHLLRQPYDLIDARRLMCRFRASVEDFQRALQQLEQEVLSPS